MPRMFFAVPKPIREIIGRVVEREGGFVDDPVDKGGATKFGITQRALSAWMEKEATTQEVKDLNLDTAVQIYYQNYWLPANLNEIGNYPLAKEFLFDWIVHSGIKTPIRHLQKLVGVKRDGSLGPISRDAISIYFNHYGSSRFPEAFGNLIDERIEFYLRITKRNTSQTRFIVGWYRRANKFRLYGDYNSTFSP